MFCMPEYYTIGVRFLSTPYIMFSHFCHTRKIVLKQKTTKFNNLLTNTYMKNISKSYNNLFNSLIKLYEYTRITTQVQKRIITARVQKLI